MKWINLVHDKDQWFVHIKRVRFFYLFFIYTWTTYSFSRWPRLCEGHPLALHPAVVDRWLLINVVFRVGIGLPNPPLITSTALCVCVSVSGRFSRDGPVPKWPIYGCLKAQVPLVWCYRNVPPLIDSHQSFRLTWFMVWSFERALVEFPFLLIHTFEQEMRGDSGGLN